MGLFNKMLGYPDPDPTGKSRTYFEKVGKQVMTMFGRGDIPRAVEHLRLFSTQQADRYGDNHADVGRAHLLFAAMSAMMTDYGNASAAALSAEGIFKATLEESDPDREAAEFLREGLDRMLEGEHPVDDPDEYLINYDTPIGKWMLRLKS